MTSTQVNTARCRYDCYQINLQVNLSEEDSCLFSRYGQSLFNIRNCSRKDDCGCCIPSTTVSTDPIPPTPVVTFPVTIPDAVILGIDIDRCDCTKATFSLHVRLPCKSFNTTNLKCAVQAWMEEYNEYASTLAADTTIDPTTAAQILALNVSMANLILMIDSCPSSDVAESATIAAEATQFLVVIPAVVTLLEANATLYKDLIAALNTSKNEIQALTLFLRRNHTLGVYLAQKFCITSGASGHEREVITFNVSPLPPRTISTGVFEKCYTYEVTRVPCRTLDLDALDACRTKTGINYAVDDGCCGVCNTQEPELVPDTLRIMFPMTKQIKCLVPDFGLSGTYFNAALGTVDTLVRLVSCSPCKFCLPAKLRFDKENCMVCLDICTQYLMNSGSDLNGYEHRFSCCEEFGQGCKSSSSCDVANLKDTLYGLQSQTVYANGVEDPFLNQALWYTLGNTVFQQLARSKRIDVMGVNKCSENVLFNFQVCYFPYRGFCVDACGCKPIKTVPMVDPVTMATTGHGVLVGTTVFGATSSYRVEAGCEFSYEFVRVSDGLVPSNTV